MSKLQAMDLTSLMAVLAELRPLILPARFEKAQQPSPQSLQLGLRSLSGLHWLELSWLAEAPRLHAIAAPPRQGGGSTLAQQLQYGLRGLALVALQQPPWERIVELGFARRPGDPVERTLVLEIMGRHSNLLLLDDARQVICLARQVRQQQSRLRPIGTGDLYQSPPALQGVAPSLQESRQQWHQRLTLQDLPLAQALQRSYQGVSPALVQQLLDPGDHALASARVGTLSPAQWGALHDRWLQWLEALAASRFGFAAAADPAAGGYRCWFPADGAQLEPSVDAGAARLAAPGTLPLNRALAHYYGDQLQRRRLLADRQAGRRRLEQLLLKERAQLQQQQARLHEGAGVDQLQHQADALLCQAHADRQALEQAQKLYQRARRLRRSGTVIRERISHHEQRLAWLEASLTYLEQAETAEAVQQLLGDLDSLERPVRGQQRRGASPQEQPCPLELRSPGGLRLQVGRNHRQNVWISLKQARRGDLWFHAQECPGSHVVLKGSEAPADEADQAAAADLAAYFSRARGNSRVPVVMVPVEALQRIAGAPAGTLRHSGGTVLWGRPEAAGARLAAASTLLAEEAP